MYGAPKFKRILQSIWDPEPQNTDHQNKIVCLGKFYDPIPPAFKNAVNDSKDTQYLANKSSSTSVNNQHSLSGSSISLKSQSSQALTEWPQEFLDDVESKLWFTYRTNFPVIPCSRDGPSSVNIGRLLRGSGVDLNGFTSDVGWGCMIRTSQSLLANSIVILQLGRDWRRPSLSNSTSMDVDTSNDKHLSPAFVLDEKEAKIVAMFADHPKCLFSVHNFVKHGEVACGKKPGEWFGPSAAASSIKALHQQRLETQNKAKSSACQTDDKSPSSSQKVPYESCFRVFISSGSDLYENYVFKTAMEKGVFHPTLILLGLRLGIDKVNEVYWDSLKAFFASPQAVGISGGRPSSSHYFYGYQGDNLFYLDPHHPKPALDPNELLGEAIETVHTRRIRYLHLSEMDPSMLMGVLIKDQDDWESWRDSVQRGPMKSIIHISREPIQLRRSSVSVFDDDDFIDVMLEPEGFEDRDGEVIVEDPNEIDFSKVFRCEDLEPGVFIDNSFPCNSSAASILDISTNSCGKIRTRSISGPCPSSSFGTPDTPSVEALKDDDALLLESSMLSLTTESGFVADSKQPVSASQKDTTRTPTSSAILSKFDLSFGKNSNDNSSSKDDPVLINHAGDKVSEDMVSLLESDVASSIDPLAIDTFNVGSLETSHFTPVSEDCVFSLPETSSSRYLHRSSESSYHDVGTDQHIPVAVAKSVNSTNHQHQTSDCDPNNDGTKLFEKTLSHLEKEPMSLFRTFNTLPTAANGKEPLANYSLGSESVANTFDTSFHEDGFQKVSPHFYDSDCSSSFNIVTGIKPGTESGNHSAFASFSRCEIDESSYIPLNSKVLTDSSFESLSQETRFGSVEL